MNDGLSPNTVLFADIAHSTGLYERFGDGPAHAYVQEALAHVRALVLHSRGIVIKAIGDELMCCFSSAPDAVNAACEIHARFQKPIGKLPRLSFRIGLHSGDAIWQENDLYGDAVNIAARLVAMAKAGQILTSGDTLKLCPPAPGRGAREIGPVNVKGRRQPVQCVEILWRDEKELTSIIREADTGTAIVRLILTYGPDSFILDEHRPSVSLGRLPENDLVVISQMVSGNHAIIERRRDKYFLHDQSTNGCIIVIADKTMRVHREEVALIDTGTIVLGGMPIEANRSIRFQIVRQDAG